MYKTEELFTQLWSVKDTGEVIISKEYDEDQILQEIEYFNDKNNEWWISEELEETTDGNSWVVFAFKN